MELASPFHCGYYHIVYKFRNHKQIYVHMRSVVGLIHHHRPFTLAAIEEQPTQKANWNPEGKRISALCREDLSKETLEQPGMVFDSNAYTSFLQACGNIKQLKQFHTHILLSGLDQNIFVAAKLVSMYAIYGTVKNARLVFDKTKKQDILLWNALIREYVSNGLCEEVLSLYYQMQEAGIQPDNFTFPFLLRACVGLSALQEGKEIHDHIIRTGFESDVFVANSLLAMYTKCGSIASARHLFDKMPKRDVVSWNSMISGYTQHGHACEALKIFNQMQMERVSPNSVTIVSVLQACARVGVLQQGKWIHDFITRSGFDLNVAVGNSLLAMYGKCGSVEMARELFDKMPKRDVVSWNGMIAAYAQSGDPEEALTLFSQMQLADMIPTSVTLVSVLQACSQLGALQQGKLIHDHIIRNGIGFDVSLGNSLMAMYAKCGSMDDARHFFDKMSKRDGISWSTMIAAYAQSGNADEAMTFFYQMQMVEVQPDSVTMVSVLQACAHVGSLQQGECVHDYVIKSGFESDVFVGNSLIDMYAKCGRVEIAHCLFDKMPKRNVVSWNTTIAGYVQNGHAKEALKLFYQMQWADVTSDSITMVLVLQACGDLGALDQGKQIHNCIIQNGLQLDAFLQNSLIDMYSKCANIEIARQLFEEMPTKNVISWSAMIAGYSQSGLSNKALTLFHQMQLAGMMPNSVTLASVLQACTHLAALQQGKWIHGYIIKSGFDSDVFVGTVLIDMYAKCGSVETARHLFDTMCEKNVVSWSSMIAGYGMHGHGEDALALFSQMQLTGIKPNHITFVSVLSACSHAGLLDEGWHYFDSMIQDYCITPRVEHYACMVDLLGRAGRLNEAQDFIEKMPLEPGASVWGALLGACRIHCNTELGQRVAERLFDLEPKNAGCYVLLSNIYAAAGRWNDVAELRAVMKDRRLKKTPGCSFIEVNNRVHAFVVGDRSHPQSEKIYAMLETLAGHMKEAGYVPETNFVLHDVEEEIKEDMLYSHSEKLAIAFGLINTCPGSPIRITKNLRVCGDCHNATKFISKIVMREIYMRDANRFHYFKDGVCSCGDYW